MEKPADVDIQWKDTDACLHLWCDCGGELHSDRPYIETLTCPDCGVTWKLPDHITADKVEC